MPVDVIAILYPGDMGHAVGRALGAAGHRIVTSLEGRGEGSRMRAERAGIEDLGDLGAVAREAELVLSILPPEAAMETARAMAAAMTAEGHFPVYADCNAVSPETAIAIAGVIAGCGARFIDGGIVGNPPGRGEMATRFYVSGPDAPLMDELDGKGIAVKQCGDEFGRASAVKMCYAAVSKGTNTLHTAALIAAEALGVGTVVREEWEASAPGVYQRMRAATSRLPADAARWVGEMEEIARTFESVGVTPHFHIGARDIFRLLAATPFAAETRETIDESRTMEQSVAEYVRHLPMREAAE